MAGARDARGAGLLATLGTPGDGAAVPGDPASMVAAWARDEETLVLLAELDDAPMGLGAGSVTRQGTALGQVRCCYVDPGARGIGLGGALVAALLNWFGDQGCTDVDALALPGDRLSKQLLESAGFKARLLVLHRPLG